MIKREFKKIKVDNTTSYLELKYKEIITKSDDEVYYHEHEVKFNQEVHQDLVDAMKNFIPHLVILVELRTTDEYKGKDLIPFEPFRFPELIGYDVSSISTGGTNEHFGVTISGRKSLKGGKVFNINTPFTKFVGGEHEEQYDFSDELSSAFNILEREVNLFLNEGKAAPKRQLELELAS